MSRVIPVLLLSLLLLPTASLAQGVLYKWKDAQGKVHYGDTPPPGVRATPLSGGVSVVPALPPELISSPAAANTESTGGGIDNPDATRRARAAEADSRQQEQARREAERKRLIERCEANRGTDCADEVDDLLSGQPGRSYVPLWLNPPPLSHRPPPPHRPPLLPVSSSSSSRARPWGEMRSLPPGESSSSSAARRAR